MRISTHPALALAALAAALLLARPAAAGPARYADAELDGEDVDLPASDRDLPDPIPDAAARIGGPAVGEVVAAASRAAGLDRDPTRGLTRRARGAGLVPAITARTGRTTSWQDADPDVNRGLTLEVRATWRLDRLVFDGRELQVAAITAARRRERRQLALHVVRTYFAWRRAAGAALVEPRWALRAEAAAGELDALTDGWFSAARARGRPAESAPTPASASPRPARGPSGCRPSCRGRAADR